MPVAPLFDHLLNTGEPDIGADAFPLGDGGSGWPIQIVARTGSAGAFALTASDCAIDGDSWNFSPPTGTFPLNYAAKIAANSAGTYDPCEILVYFVWDDTKCHLFNAIINMDDTNGNQWGAQIRLVAGAASLRAYRHFTNNSFQQGAITGFTKPSGGTNCVLRVRGWIDAAADLSVMAWVYNVDADPTLQSPIGQLSAPTTYAGTFTWTGRAQGVSMGDNANATLTSPDITRIVVNGLTSTLTLQSGGGTVNIHSVSGQRYIPVYPESFPGSPVTLDIYQGTPGTLPSGITVDEDASTLTPDDGEPGCIVLNAQNVTPDTYSLTIRGQNGGESGTVALSLVASNVLDRTADTKRVVDHGSSSMESARGFMEDEAEAIYEPDWAYTQYQNSHAATGVAFDFLLVPDGGAALAHAGLQLALANKAHYIAGGAAYYNSFNGSDLSGSRDAVIAAYDDLWGQYVKNGVHVIFIAHQETANGTNICSGNLVAFTAGADSDTLELESGDAALCEAGDGIYVTATDTNSLQFAEILSVNGDTVITEKFLRTDDLPDAGRAYWVGDKGKHQWFQEIRAELGKRGTEGEAEFIEDEDTGARVWFLTRDQIPGGYELHDIWRMYCNTDRFHVAAAGNPDYGAIVAKGVAYVDLQKATKSLDPSSLATVVGDPETDFDLDVSVDGDSAPPSVLVGGDFTVSGGVGTINSSTGEFTPTTPGSGSVSFLFDYNSDASPSAPVTVSSPGGGGGIGPGRGIGPRAMNKGFVRHGGKIG